MSNFLSPKEAADLLGLDHKTVLRWCKSGKFPATNRAPHGTNAKWGIRREHLQIIINQGANDKYRELEKMPQKRTGQG